MNLETYCLEGLISNLKDLMIGQLIFIGQPQYFLERQQKMKMRPEIIHPLDLLNSGVEVIKLTPKVQGKSENQRERYIFVPFLAQPIIELPFFLSCIDLRGPSVQG